MYPQGDAGYLVRYSVGSRTCAGDGRKFEPLLELSFCMCDGYIYD